MKKLFCAAVSVLFCLGLSSPTEASLVSYEYYGEAFLVTPSLSGSFSVGSDMKVSFSYDTEAADGETDNQVGVYTASTFSIEIDDLFTYSASGSRIIVQNDGSIASGGTLDSFSLLHGGLFGPISGADINGLSPYELMFRLADLDATVFSNDYLPSMIPPLSEFELDNTIWSLMNVSFYDPTVGLFPSAHLRGKILSGGRIDNTPVPEPSTWLLLGSGLVGLAWYGRKRKKS